MAVYSRIALGLAIFLAVAGLVYGPTSHEYVGMLLLLVASACFAYVGLYVRRAVRAAVTEAGAAAPPAEHEEPHIGPTIWPFVFSLAGVALVLGAIVSPWLLAAGGALFLAAGVGWFVDIGRQWGHSRHE